MQNRTAVPTSRTWSKLQYEDDPFAQAFIAAHPEGASIEDIAEAMGTNKARIYALIASGCRKLEHNRKVRASVTGDPVERIGECEGCGRSARLTRLPNGDKPAWYVCARCTAGDVAAAE